MNAVDWYRVAFGEIYPLVYPHRDEAEAERVAARLVPVVGEGLPLLDLACGNGRYLRALGRAGIDGYGADLSEYLLDDAVAAGGPGGRLVRCDMRALPFRDAAFGSVINMFTSFGYFANDADNQLVLREVARVLRPAGVFVLDFINAGLVPSASAGRSRRRAGEVEIEETRELVAGGRVLVKRVVVRAPGREAIEYEERVRLYGRDELGAMLALASLEVRDIHGDYDFGRFDAATSSRMILVSRRSGGR